MDNDSIAGFKKLDNTKGFTTDQLFEELNKITVSFGVPQMGQMLNKPAVTWQIGDFTVYTQADENYIKIGGVASQNIAKNILKQFGNGLLKGSLSSGNDNDASNLAVEELYGIVTKMLDGESAESIKSKIESDNSSAYEKSFFMKQKVLSLKANYNIYLEDETPVYSVTSDLTHLNFSIVKQEQEVLSLKKKMIALLPEYSILKNGQEIGHFKKQLKLTRQEVHGQLNGKEVVIQGDFSDSNYSICYDGVEVGEVNSAETFLGHSYKITAYNPELEDCIIALTIIADHLVHQAERLNSD